MTTPILISGIGTDVGKTLVASIVTEALQADYWKPVQAGFADGTDADIVQSLISNTISRIHPELYKLATPASPHIAARKEGVTIDLENIVSAARSILQSTKRPLVIEGAGGLLVPMGDDFFVADLAKALDASVILVSRNYLGSINHSLLTAAYCKANGIRVAGWIFSDDYMNYEEEIVRWSGYPSIGSIPRLSQVDATIVAEQSDRLRSSLQAILNQTK